MPPKRPMPSAHAGFTVIELMIVLVIAAFLTAVALPSFFQALERNRIVAQNNDLLASFTYARSEAIRRNGTVGVCALNATFDGCATDEWNRGWLVWADTNRSGSFNTGDEVLRIDRLDGSNRLASTVFDIRFGARGTRTLPTTNAVLNLQPEGCASPKPNRRTLTVRATGATSSVTANCT